jgi:hypothetical protein
VELKYVHIKEVSWASGGLLTNSNSQPATHSTVFDQISKEFGPSSRKPRISSLFFFSFFTHSGIFYNYGVKRDIY